MSYSHTITWDEILTDGFLAGETVRKSLRVCDPTLYLPKLEKDENVSSIQIERIVGERFSSRVTPTQEYECAVADRADRWVAACGGQEVPFVHEGSDWLYVFNPATGAHGYLHLGTDIVQDDAPWEIS